MKRLLPILSIALVIGLFVLAFSMSGKLHNPRDLQGQEVPTSD